MGRATTVLIAVVCIGGRATQDIVAVSTGEPPMVDIVVASIGGATAVWTDLIKMNARRQRDERTVIPRCLLTTQRDALEIV